MLAALKRKAGHLAADPVLRRWLLARLVRRHPAPPAWADHRPPYLGEGWEGLAPEAPTRAWPEAAAGRPEAPLTLHLAGERVTLRPGEEGALVRREFADLETALSLHRFAWVPLLAAGDDPRWVSAIWRAWQAAWGKPDGGWAWHPYTATERAVNLLAWAQRNGLPAPAGATCLAAHAPVIAAGLEWFGDHHTSNHCANNGRGLYLLGLALGLTQATEVGVRILLEEGRRLFRPGGVLREASSHYHLLLARQWASIWLAARQAGRPEAAEFETVLRRALGVLPHLALPGRFPLVGDVSPDCPPEHLFGLLPGGDLETGWIGLLPEADRAALGALRDAAPQADPAALAADGWLRATFGRWTGLWHAEPKGWSPMPGHGHQDCGAAEIHCGDEVVFLDAGRGSYARSGEADADVAARRHGGLTVDGLDPYPPNRPYYADAFRATLAGPAELRRREDGITLRHGGYRRLGITVERSWTFGPSAFTLADQVNGRGRHTITRRLVTGLAVENAGDAVLLRAPSGRIWRVGAPGAILTAEPVTLWHAYGAGRPGTVLAFTSTARLPWHGTMTVETL